MRSVWPFGNSTMKPGCSEENEAPACRIPFCPIQESADSSTTPRGAAASKKKFNPLAENGNGATPERRPKVNKFGWRATDDEHQYQQQQQQQQQQQALQADTPSRIGHHSAQASKKHGGGLHYGTPRAAGIDSKHVQMLSEPGNNASYTVSNLTPKKNVSRSLKYNQDSALVRNGGAPPKLSVANKADSYAAGHFDLVGDSSFWEDHNVQVLIRIRPFSAAEAGHSRALRQDTSHSLTWVGPPESRFTFDHVACETIRQEELFTVAGLPMVENCISGYNNCMFAYGQTGSGKTHTMLGDIFDIDQKQSNERGMIPRVFEYLFNKISKEEVCRSAENLKFVCKCSFLEIYNEQITDLLEPASTNLQLREDCRKGVYVENLTEVEVKSVHDVIKLLLQGAANRKVAATNMNRESSRSHSVFTCSVESKWEREAIINTRFGRLNLVDLAGSERQKSSGAEGDRLKEAVNINKSLSTLGLVIMVLVDAANGKPRHIPYRDSKLTFLLQDSLGGNSKTLIIATVSPSNSSALETLSTLKFAQRAKFIRNNAVVNEDSFGDAAALRQQIQQLKEELNHYRTRNMLRRESDGLKDENGVQILGRLGQDVLAGSLRREASAEAAIKALSAQIEHLNKLVKQREEDTQRVKMVLRFREEKIRRMEGIAEGLISSDAYIQEEKNASIEEIKLLRGRLDHNPEVTRFAMENIRLQNELERLQSFSDANERETMSVEIANLRDQLLELLEEAADRDDKANVLRASEEKARRSSENLVSLQGENVKLSRTVEDLENEVATLNTENETTKQQLDMSIAKLRNLEIDQEAHMGMISGLKDLLQQSEEAKTMEEMKANELQIQLAEALETIGELDASLKNVKEDLEEAQELNTILINEQARKLAIDKQMDATRSQAEAETADAITKMQDTFATTNEKELSARKHIIHLTKEISRLKEENCRLLSSCDTKDKMLDEYLDDGDASLDAAKNEVQAILRVSGTAEEKQAAVNMMQSKLQQALVITKDAEDKIRALTEVNCTLTDAQKQHDASLSDAQAEVQHLILQLETSRKEAKHLEEQLLLANNKSASFSGALRSSEAEASMLKQQANDIQAELLTVRVQMKDLESARASETALYEQEMSSRGAALSAKEQELHHLQLEHSEKSQQVRDLERLLPIQATEVEVLQRQVQDAHMLGGEIAELVEAEMTSAMASINKSFCELALQEKSILVDELTALKACRQHVLEIRDLKEMWMVNVQLKLDTLEKEKMVLKEACEQSQSREQEIISSKEATIDEFRGMLEKARTDLVSTERRKEELQKELQKSEEQRRLLDDDCMAAAAEMNDINDKVQQLGEHTSLLEQENEALSKEREYLASLSKDLQEELKISTQAAQEMQACLHAIREEVEERKQDNEVLTREKEYLESVKQSLQGKLQQNAEAAQHMQATLIALKENSEDMKCKLQQASCRAETNALSTENCTLKETIQQMELVKSNLETELEDKQRVIEGLDLELLELSSLVEQRLAESARELETVAQERDQLHADMVVLTEQLEMAQSTADEREAVAVEARRIAEASKALAEKKEEEVRTLERCVSELESTVNALENQVGIIKREAQTQRLRKEDLEMEIQNLRHDISLRDADGRNTDDSLSCLKDEVSKLKEECIEKDAQIQAYKKHIFDLMTSSNRQTAQHQQKVAELESSIEQMKSAKKGSSSPFKCMGLGLSQQMNSEIGAELSASKRRIIELESEVHTAKHKLAEAESMTHDVVRDLLGVKMDITNYAALVQDSRQKSNTSLPTNLEESESAELRKQLDDLVSERESWLEEIKRRQAELVAIRVTADTLRQRDQILSAENENLKDECGALQRQQEELAIEVKKLSGQQNLQQRIHHHAKIKEENNALKSKNEELCAKLRRLETRFSRVTDELGYYRAAQGKPHVPKFDEEDELKGRLETAENDKMHLAQKLTTLCSKVMEIAGIPDEEREMNESTALDCLNEIRDQICQKDQQLHELRFKSKVFSEKWRRLSELERPPAQISGEGRSTSFL